MGSGGRSPQTQEEEHIYANHFSDLLIGNDVFAIRGSFQHSGGPDDPFNSTVPVPSTRFLKAVGACEDRGVGGGGAGDILQFGGQISVAAIIGS